MLSVRRFRVRLILLILICTISLGLPSKAMDTHKLEFQKAWVRATPSGATTAAVYGVLKNHGSSERVLIAVTTDAARTAMLHETVIENGMMRMQHLTRMTIAPGESITLKPGAVHIMLTDLWHGLNRGDTISISLEFENGNSVDTVAQVGMIGQMEYPEN